jgi:hypothetical protein
MTRHPNQQEEIIQDNSAQRHAALQPASCDSLMAQCNPQPTIPAPSVLKIENGTTQTQQMERPSDTRNGSTAAWPIIKSP